MSDRVADPVGDGRMFRHCAGRSADVLTHAPSAWYRHAPNVSALDRGDGRADVCSLDRGEGRADVSALDRGEARLELPAFKAFDQRPAAELLPASRGKVVLASEFQELEHGIVSGLRGP